MLRSASSASEDVGSLVMATVNAPARRASASISIVSSVRPVVEMPIATVSESWMAALVEAAVDLRPGVRRNPDAVEPALQLVG